MALVRAVAAVDVAQEAAAPQVRDVVPHLKNRQPLQLNAETMRLRRLPPPRRITIRNCWCTRFRTESETEGRKLATKGTKSTKGIYSYFLLCFLWLIFFLGLVNCLPNRS